MDKREEEGSITILCQKFFISQWWKKFIVEPFSVSLISAFEKFYASEGYVTIFCRIFFLSQYRKIS